jgi:hypothetical protein
MVNKISVGLAPTQVMVRLFIFIFGGSPFWKNQLTLADTGNSKIDKIIASKPPKAY